MRAGPVSSHSGAINALPSRAVVLSPEQPAKEIALESSQTA